jgi:hypothetical protein
MIFPVPSFVLLPSFVFEETALIRVLLCKCLLLCRRLFVFIYSFSGVHLHFRAVKLELLSSGTFLRFVHVLMNANNTLAFLAQHNFGALIRFEGSVTTGPYI